MIDSLSRKIGLLKVKEIPTLRFETIKRVQIHKKTPDHSRICIMYTILFFFLSKAACLSIHETDTGQSTDSILLALCHTLCDIANIFLSNSRHNINLNDNQI